MQGVSTLQQLGSNMTICRSNHLTSFAVLISRRAPAISELEKILSSSITYILLSASLICLVATFGIYFYAGKEFIKIEMNILYFNYLIALTLATALFIFGIETVYKYNIPCTIVALLLHYFWTAVFSWALCNGMYIFYKLWIGKLDT